LLLKRIHTGMHKPEGTLVSMFRTWKAALAVAAVLVLAVGVWMVASDGQKRKGDVPAALAQKDIAAPAVNRAMITLADGSRVYLDSAVSGELALLGNVKLVKLSDGQIAYQSADGRVIKELQYNTLTNPRGSKVIDIKLSDGTQVWLNSGSSITYPVAFMGKERQVAINGEAYFEVAANTSMPFHVKKGSMDITVLGTSFNVNAYDDEEDTKVTLLQGSVKVANSGSSTILKPGEQAIAIINNQLSIIKPDLEEVMSWKNGWFEFNNTNLQTILKQISRWYDVDIVYEGQPKLGPLGGGISRNLPLSQVLKLLEANGARFKWEGKVLRVM
jgi:transmembrane sensor